MSVDVGGSNDGGGVCGSGDACDGDSYEDGHEDGDGPGDGMEDRGWGLRTCGGDGARLSGRWQAGKERDAQAAATLEALDATLLSEESPQVSARRPPAGCQGAKGCGRVCGAGGAPHTARAQGLIRRRRRCIGDP